MHGDAWVNKIIRIGQAILDSDEIIQSSSIPCSVYQKSNLNQMIHNKLIALFLLFLQLLFKSKSFYILYKT